MPAAEAAAPGCVFAAHGADAAEAAELEVYAANAFAPAALPDAGWPLPDEPCAAAWDGYAARAAGEGTAAALRGVFPQLRFPVQAGIAASDGYRAATLRGEAVEHPAGGVPFRDPEGLRIFLHPTPAGRLPVVVARDREDFVALVRAVTRRNEPSPVPPSMGACIVGGYNNWERVGRLRRAWEASHPSSGAGEWSAHFRAEVVPRRELYQDRFVLLSSGPYSAVPAEALGADPAAWSATSLAIRLEHECAHYFTRRAWGSMRNSLHDELIADYHGLRAGAGRYRADWLTRFLGVEGERYREGGRLENYRGDPPLSDDAFRVLQRLVQSAATALEAIDALRPAGPASSAETARALGALASLSLTDLAGPSASDRFAAAYAHA